MFNKIAEKTMHRVRWVLTIGWLLLIFSLFYDPISPYFTDPSNQLSPFRIDPTKCVTQIQGECFYEYPYPMGAKIFWGMVIPVAVMLLLTFGHEAWRRICPLSFLSQIPRHLGKQRHQKIVNPKTGKVRYEIFEVKKDSWLGRNHLYFQFGLLCLGLCIRILFVNSNRLALGLFLMFTIGCAIAVGYLYKGKAWCQYFCPMAPVQMIYNGPRSLFGSEAHQGQKQAITQSMCRTVTGENMEKSACVSCQSPCIDIDAERSYWEILHKPGRKLTQYGYVGLVIGFYIYYFLFSGNFDYYYSGVWSYEKDQLQQLFQPGFYIANQAIPIPKIIAAPITIAACVAATYFLFDWIEKTYKGYRQKIQKPINQDLVLHHIFSVCTFSAFNIYFMFGGRPVLKLLPTPLQLFFNSLVIAVSIIWLYRTLSRSGEMYKKESLANSLRRQLSKLTVDFSQYLEGRSLADLKADEVYVLATVLPGVNRAYGTQVYKGLLKEALEQGNVNSANSLEFLQQIRQELGLKEEEHFEILTEVGIESPDLLDPSKQRSKENQLRLESYRQALELQLLELVETGVPLQLALQQKALQITALKEEYAINAEEEAQILNLMFDENSAILRKAEVLLNQLKELAFRYQVLSNLVPDPQAPIFVLLRRVAIAHKQELVAKQLLSIMEILGNLPETVEIARSTGILAENVLGKLLQGFDQQVPWLQRLDREIIPLLKPSAPDSETEGLTTGSAPTLLPSDRESANSASMMQRLQSVVAVLQELIQDVDPLVDAASLYGLAKIAPDVAKEQARELLDQQNPVHWLVRETAEQVLTNSELLGFHSSNANEQLSVKVSTLIARVAAMGKIQEFIFQQPEVRVGRSPVNDIAISDLRVLQQHAVFAVDEKGVTVIDLTSSTGVRVGDRLIKGDRLRLNQGDTVRFGRLAEPAITIHWEQRAIESKHPTELTCTLDKLLLLFDTPFLQSINPEALIDLARDAIVEIFEPGEKLCQQGEISDEILVLVSGAADVTIIRGDREETINTIKPGEIIGEMGVLTRQTRSSSVVATAATNRVLVVKAHSFENLLNQHPELSRNLLLLMSNRLQSLTAKVKSF